MIVAVPVERAAGERRVALVPDVVAQLVRAGYEIRIARGAGEAAGFPDAAYEKAGASIATDGAALYDGAHAVLRVRPPTDDEIAALPKGALLISFLQPALLPETVRALANAGVTSLSMDLVPRITRAQKMDALSSQATVAGYEAALMAASRLNRFFPMLTTAAGTMPPAKVIILGAGVAGLQAIATARRLGAVVSAFDIRPAVKEQVESLGATFVGIVVEDAETAGGYAREVGEDIKQRQHELLRKVVSEVDVVIGTAQIPGRRAPILVTADMIPAMRPGSVIIDLAAETGGNCELTRPGEEFVQDGVTIVGPVNVPSMLSAHASQMYARNIAALLTHVVADGEIRIDLEEEIVRGCCVTHGGSVVHPMARELAGAGH